jgi:hypothetical protein
MKYIRLGFGRSQSGGANVNTPEGLGMGSLPGLVHQKQRLRAVPVVKIMRTELEVLLQFSRLRHERDHAGRVEVVALAFVAVMVRTRIAGLPVHGVEFGSVGAGQPVT